MKQEGMCEILNPSDILISEKDDNPAGSCIIATMEGTRPILVELQALTSQSVFGFPKRSIMFSIRERVYFVRRTVICHTGKYAVP